jgi:hypothetical protein
VPGTQQGGLSPTEKAGAISILHSSLSNVPLANAFLAFSSAYPQRSANSDDALALCRLLQPSVLRVFLDRDNQSGGIMKILIITVVLLLFLFIIYRTVRKRTFLRNLSVGNIPKIMKALKRGVNINMKDAYGNTPLILISCLNEKDLNGVCKVCKMLIEKGADIDAKNFIGATPLIKAIEKDNPEVVKLLLQAGVDVNTNAHKGVTALMIAAEWNAGRP